MEGVAKVEGRGAEGGTGEINLMSRGLNRVSRAVIEGKVADIGVEVEMVETSPMRKGLILHSRVVEEEVEVIEEGEEAEVTGEEVEVTEGEEVETGGAEEAVIGEREEVGEGEDQVPEARLATLGSYQTSTL